MVPTVLALSLAPHVPVEMVRVPAGEFLMGSDPAADARADVWEMPQHQAGVPEHLIARTPVTVAQFAAFVEATGYLTTAEQHGHGWNLVRGDRTGGDWKETKGAHWQAPLGRGSSVQGRRAHPVTLVSWYDALAFCGWATEVTQRSVYLPSEAEWERAARGTDGRIYPWGDGAPTAELCNFDLNVGDTTPVERYSPQGDSPTGCADMVGNVLEWTRSLWGSDVKTPEFPYPYTERAAAHDDTGAADVVRRVVRGGAWDDSDDGVRAACRVRNPPNSRNDLLGFRVCATVIAGPVR